MLQSNAAQPSRSSSRSVAFRPRLATSLAMTAHHERVEPNIPAMNVNQYLLNGYQQQIVCCCFYPNIDRSQVKGGAFQLFYLKIRLFVSIMTISVADFQSISTFFDCRTEARAAQIAAQLFLASVIVSLGALFCSMHSEKCSISRLK